MILDLTEKMLQGDSYAMSRLISMIENERLIISDLMKEIKDHPGHAYCIGITGSPGAGKSTLTSQLTMNMRKASTTVGVVACDPSSPYSGGAILGDRIRMGSTFLDPGVFIRSMATRGNLGGLPQKVHAVVSLMDAFGKDFILLETVGVGQAELDVRCIAETNILVLTPTAGDHIQAMKSGIMEIADIFVINKIDKGEPNVTEEDLAAILDIRIKPGQWRPPIVQTQAIEGVGTAECMEAVEAHRQFLSRTGTGERLNRENRKRIFAQIMKELLLRKVKQALENDATFQTYASQVEENRMDPYLACDKILADMDIWQTVFPALEKD